MRLVALLAVSNALLGASAGPAAKRQDESSSITTTSSSSKTSTTSSSTTEAPSSALQETTLSDGRTTTIEVDISEPTASGDATTTGTDSPPSSTASGSGAAAPVSTGFPICNSTNAKPFCLPSDRSILHVGKTYIVNWNPKFASDNGFASNSTVQIKMQWANDSNTEAWSSSLISNGLGHTTVKMEEDWLQGYSIYNLTFRAFYYDKGNPLNEGKPYDGPMITLEHAPPNHYPPPPTNKIDKQGLLIGLPIGLTFVVVVVVGLFIGMRKNRIIGVGNIMGRHNRGYGVGKSRRQRLGLGKKGAIRLEDRGPMPQYNDTRGHSRGDSLGSLVSDDGIRPAPGTNHFRDEINRQRTGR
ncbi:hypothetical protein K458DRAFT_414004 [Lentithecium fluviatile CBS 122367]|uniref:Uncharacterized protein n=1 Tax=Lentithecium fluviatile CBS 122367 TaxID=1168545 RepID=A0A6G1JGS1_9PLEO|nr:hypothetical protein K458DRAFT_414004 [Lentithecium fluviatile CBS 122367]